MRDMEHLTRRQQAPPSPRGRLAPVTWALRLGVLVIVLALCIVSVGLIYFRTRDIGGEPITLTIGGTETTVEPGTGLNPAERAYLRGYLTLRAAQIEEPAGINPAPITFVVDPGESATRISERLDSAGLIADATLFRYYLRYYDLDSKMEAGEFALKQTMTIPEIAQALTHALADEIELRIPEGWRLEQTADLLRTLPELGLDPDEFLMLARRQPLPTEAGSSPGASADRVDSHDFVAGIPSGASLEGYLFPDTYRLPADANTVDLIDTMLFTFGQRVAAEIRQAAAEQGLTLHGAVTLASIVEREAQLAEERPIIASVFLNRLAQGIKLDADPTVQYALGYQGDAGDWWKRPLTFADLEIDSPYNTYRYEGLPPGPIASPGLASIEAVVYPAETSFLFFVVDCTSETPGAHIFAETFEEHQANVARCR